MASSRVRLVIALAAVAVALGGVGVGVAVERVRDLGADVSSALSVKASASSRRGRVEAARPGTSKTDSASTSPGPLPAASPDVQRDTRNAVPAPSSDPPDAGQVSASTALPTHPLQRCPNKLRLLASIVNAARPQLSLAAVKVGDGTRLLNLGERIDDLTLVALRPARAVLQPDRGPVCFMPVFLPIDERPKIAAKQQTVTNRVPAQKTPAPALSAEELRTGVRRLSDNTFAVSRSLLLKALASPTALRRGARFRVHRPPGEVSGIALLALRKGSPLSALGLSKGDLLNKLNGHDLADPAAALQALALLKTERRFSLAVVRDGAPQTITYEVD